FDAPPATGLPCAKAAAVIINIIARTSATRRADFINSLSPNKDFIRSNVARRESFLFASICNTARRNKASSQRDTCRVVAGARHAASVKTEEMAQESDALLTYLQARQSEMLDFVRWLVEQESMSRDAAATARIAENFAAK